MLAIYKRELKSYFHTVIGFLFVSVTLFMLGLYFVVYNLLNGYPYYSYAVQGCSLIILVAIPVLTMRMLAEERRNKTDQLLLTAPVSTWKIVLGKYLAAVTVFAIPSVISCIYPLILKQFGTVPMGETYVSILAFFLYGCTCIAIGTFMSSLFENLILAAVLTFVALFLGYMMASICSVFSDLPAFITNVLGFYDLYTPMSDMMVGVIEVTGIVYYITLIALFLFLTTQSIQKRRYSVSPKHFTFGAYSALGIVVSIAIFVFVNIAVRQLPTAWTSFDCSYNKMYSLTDQTKEYIASLDQDITIYVLSSEDDCDDTVSKMLSEYESGSKHIKVTYVDPNVSPKFYETYTSTAPSSNSIIVVSDKNSKVIDYDDIYEVSYSLNYSTYSYDTTYTGYDGEGQVTGAIDYVLSDDMPVMYITEGHGENELDDTYTASLSKANIKYETINLMDYDELPDDTACLLINGPTTDFSSDDVDKVTAYLDKGGKVILTLTLPDDGAELTNVNSLMNYMDMTYNPGLIIEQNAGYYYMSQVYEIPDMSSSTYTTNLYGSGYRVFAPANTGIILSDAEDCEVSYDVFLKTSDSAFLMADYATATDYSMRDGDIEGSFPIGVEATKEITDADGNTLTPTMVVYASTSMFTSAADQMVSDSNKTLFMNTVSAFVSKEMNVSIAVKSFDLTYLTTTWGDVIKIGVVVMLILPIGLLVAGIVIWARRRKH